MDFTNDVSNQDIFNSSVPSNVDIFNVDIFDGVIYSNVLSNNLINELPLTNGILTAKNINVSDNVGIRTSTYTSNFNVNGTSIFNSNVTINGNLSQTGTSNVTFAGLTTLSSNLSVAGTATIYGTLKQTGTSNVIFAGLTTLSSNLSVAGNVGIGTNNDLYYTLNVGGRVQTINTISIKSLIATDYSTIEIRNNTNIQGTIGIGGTSIGGYHQNNLFIHSTNSTIFHNRNDTSSTVPRMIIDSRGYVGIGTNDPVSLFHVNGTSTFNSNITIAGRLSQTGTSNVTFAGLTTLSSNLSVTSNVGIRTTNYTSNFNVNGTSYFNSNVTIGDGILELKDNNNVIITSNYNNYIFTSSSFVRFNYGPEYAVPSGTSNIIFNATMGNIKIGNNISDTYSYPILKNVINNEIRPVVWYKFDSNLNDDGIVRNTLILSNTINYSTSSFVKNGISINFNKDGYLTIPSFDLNLYSDIYNNAGGITISLWVRVFLSNSITDGRILEFGDINNNIYISKNGSSSTGINFGIFSNGSSVIQSFNSLSSSWNHIVWIITKSTSAWTIYINNSPINTTNKLAHFPNSDPLSHKYLFNRSNDSNVNGVGNIYGNMQMYMDDVRVYYGTLDAISVNELFNGRVDIYKNPSLLVNGNATIGGLTTLNSNLSVTSNVGIRTTNYTSNFNVNGTSAFNSNITIAGTLSQTGTSNVTFAGLTTLSSNLSVTGRIGINTTSYTSNFNVNGTSAFNSNVTIAGTLIQTGTSNVTFAGLTTLNSNLSVTSNVGIRTTNYTSNFNVNGTSAFNSNVTIAGTLIQTGTSNVTFAGLTTLSSNLSVTGRMGLNIADPKARLHVGTDTGSTSVGIGTVSYINSGGITTYNHGGGFIDNMCALFETNIWCKASVYASSDIRIKNEIEDINDISALEKILLIQPKTYKYIDRFLRKSNTIIGFIAQQIKQVIPEAIQLSDEYIPNIYKQATANENIINLDNTEILKVNDNIRIIDKNGNFKSSKIIEVNETSIKIDDNYNNDDVFVYGTEVNDFHTLDKTYIFTLNVCATQELYRQIQNQNKVIESLQTQINELKDFINKNNN